VNDRKVYIVFFGCNDMRYGIVGDVHGMELNELDEALTFENPDVLICTGDFDRTRAVRQFMGLEEKFLMAGKKVIKVPGNHDHAILNNIGINSGTLRRQGKTSEELHAELMKDPVALKYIKDLVESEDPRYTNNRVRISLDGSEDFRTVIMHGAYDGYLPEGYPEGTADLWTRLRTEEDYGKNFEAMDKKGYKVMIRGHDHKASYVYDDSVKGIVAYTPKGDGAAFRLLGHRKHVINSGALSDGFFAMIDTEDLGEKSPVLKFHEL
jgi:predicted phosphodiesterase